MQKVILSFCTVVFFVTGYSTECAASPEQYSPDSLIKKCYISLCEKEKLSFKVDFKFKFFSDDDTAVKITARCIYVRDKGDSLMGAKIKFDFADGYRNTIYDGNKIYQFNRHPLNMFVLVTDPYMEKSNPLKTVIDYSTLEKYFLSPNLLLKLLQKGYPIKCEGTCIRNEVECDVVTIDIPDTDESFNQHKTFYISKKDYLPITIIHRVEDRNGDFQYSEHNFFNFKTPDSAENDFSISPLEEGLRIILSEDLKKQWNIESLPINTEAPLLLGKLFPSKISKSLSEYKGELILLDFWYMACGPCVQAIPSIDSLYRKYKSKGLEVIGINSVDNTPIQMKKMIKFLSHNSLTYSILLSDKMMDELYHINVYPTVYLINKEGKIIYSHKGFQGSLPEELENLIKKNLNL